MRDDWNRYYRQWAVRIHGIEWRVGEEQNKDEFYERVRENARMLCLDEDKIVEAVKEVRGDIETYKDFDEL